MKTGFKAIIISFFLLVLISAISFLPKNDAIAEEMTCPSNMDPDSRECLDYLRDQLADINKTNSKIESQLKDEAYKQLTLEEKLKYINNQIVQTTQLIKVTEVEIAAYNIEIKIMEDDIEEIEDSIALSKQEITQLEKSVNSRLTESYKYTFISPLEIFFNSTNLDNILRKTKYLFSTKEKDTEQLEALTLKKDDLQLREQQLTLENASLLEVRRNLEIEQENILIQKADLDKQKAEKDYLLAQSQKKERELLATLDANRITQALLDEAVMKYVAEHGDQMANYGWVNKGDWIGNMGGLASGCSTGPHLHFSIDYMSTSYYNGYGQIDPWSGYLTKSSNYYAIASSGWKYYYITGNSFRMPLSGTVILTQDHHVLPRKSIDIYSLNGYGSPMYAAMSGELSKGTDRCGDTYAVIKNTSTGLRTAYFHLQ